MLLIWKLVEEVLSSNRHPRFPRGSGRFAYLPCGVTWRSRWPRFCVHTVAGDIAYN